jgi:transposase-like protein
MSQRFQRLTGFTASKELAAIHLSIAPELAIADGALCFWADLDEIFRSKEGQLCRVHKMANFLGKLPRSKQPETKRMFHEIYEADTRKDAVKAFDRFGAFYDVTYPKATACLSKTAKV